MWLYKRILQPAFKIEVDGVEEIPHEPCIFIANHNIGALIEILALRDTWDTNFPGRPVFGLAHPLAFKIPGFDLIARKIGAIPATYEDAFAALEKRASLIIFPGETGRPFAPIPKGIFAISEAILVGQNLFFEQNIKSFPLPSAGATP